MKEKKKFIIGISCIGSGVGQSVITSCRLSSLPLKTIGFGTNPFAFGAYECDEFDYTPNIYSDDFIDVLIDKCIKHNIDLLIPGRDDEALLYAINKEKFDKAGIKILVSSREMIEVCRDKEKMSLELNPILNVFVDCYDLQNIRQALSSGKAKFPLIAKPRGGFASQGIEILLQDDDLSKIKGDHIIQELAIPLEDDPNYTSYLKQIERYNNAQVSEISIQVVLGKSGGLIGKMASYNKLNNGVPIEVVPYDNKVIWDVVDTLLPIFKAKGFVGPLNIQGRLTKFGFKVFEMNPRFTGITGLRALMGFNEVEACIKSWLDIEPFSIISINNDRFGIRQTTDKSISMRLNTEVDELYRSLNKRSQVIHKKVVAITGATGFLGQGIINELLHEDVELIAFGRNLQQLEELFPIPSVKKYTYASLDNGEVSFGSIDLLVHCAFARPHCSEAEIAESLAFTNGVFARAGLSQVPAVVNLSSQSVYGQQFEPLWREDGPVAPRGSYAQAKFASELMLESIKVSNPHIMTTSLRLSALSGGQSGYKPVDFLSKMVEKAFDQAKIEISGGNQMLEIMDIRDAARFIKHIILEEPKNWEPVYNIGAGGVYKLIDVANAIAERFKVNKLGKSIEVSLNPSDITMRFGMDNSLFIDQYGVKPIYHLTSTIDSLIDYIGRRS